MELENGNEGQEVIEQVAPEVNLDGSQINQDITEAGTPANPSNVSLEDWKKDKRYGTMWHTADDVYKSHMSMEKMYPESKKNYDTLKGKVDNFSKFLEENGFNFDTFQDDIGKFKDYRNPESEINQVYNYINPFLKNPLYSDKVVAFFNELESTEIQRKYPNMNAEQIRKMQEQEQRVKQLEKSEEQRQQEALNKQQTEVAQKGFDSCEQLAKEYGFTITPEVKNYLIGHCLKNDIDPKYIQAEFFSLYGKQLMSARDKKILNAQQTNKTKLQNAQIIGGASNKTATPPATLKGEAAYKAGWNKIFGKSS